jgi:hypothetical protein
MHSPRVFNPDDYLQTEAGRVYTDERNAAAWERIYSELEGLFRDSTADTRFFIVLGVQGGGKTSWISRHIGSLGSSAICLDAALPARRHRARALALAQRFSVYSIAVWINVTLERALEQNSKRAPDHVVPEFAIRSVFGLIEAPTVEEGFREIIEVADDDGGA